jgi:hypothetical protein
MITAGASGYRHGAIAHDAADMGRHIRRWLSTHSSC